MLTACIVPSPATTTHIHPHTPTCTPIHPPTHISQHTHSPPKKQQQPYASSYILNGQGQLPAWPIRVACSKLAVCCCLSMCVCVCVHCLYDTIHLHVYILYVHKNTASSNIHIQLLSYVQPHLPCTPCPHTSPLYFLTQDPSLQGPPLISAMMDAVGVFYNWSGHVPCFDWSTSVNNETKEDGDFWYGVC